MLNQYFFAQYSYVFQNTYFIMINCLISVESGEGMGPGLETPFFAGKDQCICLGIYMYGWIWKILLLLKMAYICLIVIFRNKLQMKEELINQKPHFQKRSNGQ